MKLKKGFNNELIWNEKETVIICDRIEEYLTDIAFVPLYQYGNIGAINNYNHELPNELGKMKGKRVLWIWFQEEGISMLKQCIFCEKRITGPALIAVNSEDRIGFCCEDCQKDIKTSEFVRVL